MHVDTLRHSHIVNDIDHLPNDVVDEKQVGRMITLPIVLPGPRIVLRHWGEKTIHDKSAQLVAVRDVLCAVWSTELGLLP